MSKNSDLTFEQAMQRLEEIVNKLMNSGVPLEEMISLYEQGVLLSKQCLKQLDEYDARIDILSSSASEKAEPSLCEEI